MHIDDWLPGVGCSSRPKKPLKHKSIKMNLIMQNKPNLLDSQMNANKVLTKDYANILPRPTRKNKPNSNPIQTQLSPKQSQFKPNMDPKQTQSNPNQTQCKSRSQIKAEGIKKAKERQDLIGTNSIETKADLARHLGISRARVTQVLRKLPNHHPVALNTTKIPKKLTRSSAVLKMRRTCVLGFTSFQTNIQNVMIRHKRRTKVTILANMSIILPILARGVKYKIAQFDILRLKRRGSSQLARQFAIGTY